MMLHSESSLRVFLYSNYKPWYLPDVETAFLHGSFQPGEEVYMNCPPGMVHQTDEYFFILTTLCGLIQAARHYFNFFSKIIVKIGFKQSPADPCLFLFKNAMGTMLVIVYVDDVGLAYSSYALVEFLFNQSKKRNINYTVEHLILFNKSRTKAWLGQPHLIKKLRTLFAGKISHLKNYATPGTPALDLYRDICGRTVFPFSH